MFPSMASTVLFAGKKTAGDPWQIWELTLKDRSRAQSDCDASGRRTAVLSCPAGGWCGRERTAAGFQLDSAEDGHPPDHLLRIRRPVPACCRSHTRRAARSRRMCLRDGRILFESGFPLGSGSTPELYLVYADGSGVESYRCDHGRGALGRKAVGFGRRGVYARQLAGAVHFAAGARGAGRRAARRVRGRDCGDRIGRRGW